MVYQKSPKNFTVKLVTILRLIEKDFIKHCGTTKHGIKWYTPNNSKNKYFECKEL